MQTDDVQDELAATLGGVYANVEKGVGAEMTEASDEPEGELSTESATSEGTSAQASDSSSVESAAAPIPELSSPEAIPDTVVAAEGTTGVEAKLADPTPAAEVVTAE